MANVQLMVQGVNEIQGQPRPLKNGDKIITGIGGMPYMKNLGAPAASAVTGILASLAGNAAGNAFTISAQPDKPRNIAIAFAASWDGGDVTLVGTDQFDNPITETIVAVANSTVVGNKAFKTITSATKGAVGAASAAATGGPGSKLGIDQQLSEAAGILAVTGVPEAATFNTTYNTVLPGTNVPNGTRTYVALVNV